MRENEVVFSYIIGKHKTISNKTKEKQSKVNKVIEKNNYKKIKQNKCNENETNE